MRASQFTATVAGGNAKRELPTDKAQVAPVCPHQEDTVRLEINAATLRRLLKQNAICATEFHCLDGKSKHCVWELFFKNLRRLRVDGHRY